MKETVPFKPLNSLKTLLSILNWPVTYLKCLETVLLLVFPVLLLHICPNFSQEISYFCFELQLWTIKSVWVPADGDEYFLDCRCLKGGKKKKALLYLFCMLLKGSTVLQCIRIGEKNKQRKKTDGLCSNLMLKSSWSSITSRVDDGKGHSIHKSSVGKIFNWFCVAIPVRLCNKDQ